MDELQKQARRLRELFHGRFSQDEAIHLLSHYGENAALCVLQAEPREISRILGNEDNSRRFSQEEYERASRLLEEGLEIDSEPRQFACRDCERCWWKRVPGRKKVSTCFRCKQKFEPIPKDKEWGTGRFECHHCQFEFRASAIMGVTKCVCHKCNHTVAVTSIIPPSELPDFPPNKDTHDCNGVNCYRRHVCPPYCHDCPNAEEDENIRRPSNYRLQDLLEMELRINRLPNHRPYHRGGRRRNFRRRSGSPPGGGRPGGPDDDDAPDDHPQNHGASRAEGNHCNGEVLVHDGSKSATNAVEDGSGQNADAEFGGEALDIKLQVLRLRVSDSSQDEAGNSSASNSEVQENEPENNGKPKKKRHRKKKQRQRSQGDDVENNKVERMGNQDNDPQFNQYKDDAVSETTSSNTNGGDYFPDFPDDGPPNPGNGDPPKTPLCHHARSRVPNNAVVRTWSERHVSTGSTVTTCIDQISLRTQSVRLAYKMFGDD